MLGVDEGDNTAHGLGLSENLEREGRLARRLGAVDLYDTSAWHAADAERRVERQRSRRNRLDIEILRTVAVLHDGALAELLLDLGSRRFHHLVALFAVHLLMDFTCHGLLSHCYSLLCASLCHARRTIVRRQSSLSSIQELPDSLRMPGRQVSGTNLP